MTEKQLSFIISINKNLDRQGPGSDQETLKAIALTRLSKQKNLSILDLGCGTGAQTNVLAKNLNGTVHALDLFEPFLEELTRRYPPSNIITSVGSMDDLPFENQSFDLIWSEGAIYNMGFAHGLNYLRPFLKKQGIIAVSEITWLTQERPKEIQEYWMAEYREIDTIQGKTETLTNSGFQLIDYFTIREKSWLDNYYDPLTKELQNIQANSPLDEEQSEIINAYKNEIDLYKRFKKYFGYGFYVAQRLD